MERAIEKKGLIALWLKVGFSIRERLIVEVEVGSIGGPPIECAGVGPWTAAGWSRHSLEVVLAPHGSGNGRITRASIQLWYQAWCESFGLRNPQAEESGWWLLVALETIAISDSKFSIFHHQ